jgi:hypothetical protein
MFRATWGARGRSWSLKEASRRQSSQTPIRSARSLSQRSFSSEESSNRFCIPSSFRPQYTPCHFSPVTSSSMQMRARVELVGLVAFSPTTCSWGRPK